MAEGRVVAASARVATSDAEPATAAATMAAAATAQEVATGRRPEAGHGAGGRGVTERTRVAEVMAPGGCLIPARTRRRKATDPFGEALAASVGTVSRSAGIATPPRTRS